jgi:hypothetical protein
MGQGIRNSTVLAADLVLVNDTFVTSGLQTPIAAGEKKKITWWLPITVGATGGAQVQIAAPAGGVSFVQSTTIFNFVAPAVTGSVIQAAAAVGAALANAGNHLIIVEATIENGATAGFVQLQIAQNTTDVLTATLIAGASQDAITVN